MTPTEQRAHRWLQAQGYARSEIRFQPRRSPDFLTDDGYGWEVKLIAGQTVNLTLVQLAAMRRLGLGMCRLLVFGPSDPCPLHVLLVDALAFPGTYKGLRFSVTDNRIHHRSTLLRDAVYVEQQVERLAASAPETHISDRRGVCSCGHVAPVAFGRLRQLPLAPAPVAEKAAA